MLELRKLSPFILLGLSPAMLAQAGSKPNVVFILADDLGYGDIGCYGQRLIETPNIDALAKRGLRFTDFYAGCSVSAPSRASLMTGLHTGHTKIRGNKEIQPEGQEPMAKLPTLGNLFRQAGYRTGIFGKWGLGYPGSGAEPLDRGFDTFYGYNCQRESHLYYPEHLWQDRARILLPANKDNARQVYAPQLIQEAGLRFIADAVGDGRPFFAMLTYTLPHAELNLPHGELYHKYRQRLTPKPWEPSWAGGYPATPDAHASFAAMVEQLDRYVGQVCQQLEDLGVLENTLIVFTSDNGPHLEGGADPEYFDSNGPLRGTKRALYEGGIRVPMIVTWPEQIKASTVHTGAAAFWDWHQTFASLLGQPSNTDGIDLMPALTRGASLPSKRNLFWEFHEEGGRMAIRQGQWKLIQQGVNADCPTWELYNLKQDLGEEHNLIDKYPRVAARLKREMLRMHTPSALFPWRYDRQQALAKTK